MSDPTQRPPGRPRSARADGAILQAALEAFIEEGYEGMSMEGVAARAGVGKTTVYRRWPCKQDVLLAAIESLFDDFHPADTGDVRADLIAVVKQAHHFLTKTQTGQLVPRMVVEVTTGSPLGRAYSERILGPRLRAVRKVIEAAKDRGEVRGDLDDQLAVAAIVGSLILLRIAQALPTAGEDLADRLVGQLIEGMGTSWRSPPDRPADGPHPYSSSSGSSGRSSTE